MKIIIHLILPCIVTSLFLDVMLGCQSKEQQSPKIETAQSHSVKKEMSVVIPDSVRGKWRAIKIAVTDKQTTKQTIYTVPLEGKTTLTGSSITIEAEVFLPAFIMEGSAMTSASNQLKNPGAKIRITDGSSTIFKGWLFSLFPTTHAFTHPRYGFTLIDAIPATTK